MHIARQKELLQLIESFTEGEMEFVLSRLLKKKAEPRISTRKSLNDLAPEIISIIFSYLHSASSISTCSQVCRQWRAVFHDNHTWRQVCKKRSYISYIPRFRSRSSSELAKGDSMKGMSKQPSLFPWRNIYMNNYLTWKNWALGKYRVTSIVKDSLPIEFDERKAFSVKRGQPGQLWDLATGTCNLRLEHPAGQISTVKFSEKYVAAGFDDGAIRIWDIKLSKWSMNLLGHSHEVGALHLLGDVLVSGSEDQTIRVWELKNGTEKCLSLRGHTGSISSVFSYQQYIVSGSTDSTIKIWSVQSGRCVRTLRGHEGSVFCVQMDSKIVCSGGEDSIIRIWDIITGRQIKSLKGHHNGVVSLQFDQTKLVSGSVDKTIKVWNLKTGHCCYSLMQHTSSIWNVKFNKSQIISSSFDNSLLVWDFSHSTRNE